MTAIPPAIGNRRAQPSSAFLSLAYALVVLAILPVGEEVIAAETHSLENSRAVMEFATEGGAIIGFRLTKNPCNPLDWRLPAPAAPGETAVEFRGHFVCVDRWGPPSEADARSGMPYHGEAARMTWSFERQGEAPAARMTCELPLAGLNVERKIQLEEDQAWALVREKIENSRPLGRIFNLVQHPTIAPPFLDETTLVDTNAVAGFDQDSAVPARLELAASWPMLSIGGSENDLRRFLPLAEPKTTSDVTSWVFRETEKIGWVTASSPRAGFLLGYVWPLRDYPWLNLWRMRDEGKLSARGLEFGTTGLHQPLGELARRGRALDRPLVDYLDALTSTERTFGVFLFEIPSDFQGVERLSLQGGTLEAGRLELIERKAKHPRVLAMPIVHRWAD